MGPEIYFTGLVITIGALDLIWRAVGYLDHHNQTGLSLEGRTTVERRKRDDWYVFFRLSDLLGPEESEADRPRSADRPHTTRRRQSPRMRL